MFNNNVVNHCVKSVHILSFSGPLFPPFETPNMDTFYAVSLTTTHKHLGMILDSKLSFEKQLKSMLSKIIKDIGLPQKLQVILPRATMLTIYKQSAKPHLDYADQKFKEYFHQKIEPIQYNAAIAMTGAIRGTSSEKLYQESLRSRTRLRKICLFYKIYKNKSFSYFYDLIPDRVKFYSS